MSETIYFLKPKIQTIIKINNVFVGNFSNAADGGGFPESPTNFSIGRVAHVLDFWGGNELVNIIIQ